MRRIIKVALGGVASCALVLGGTQVAVGALPGTYKFKEALTDLLTADPGPFDSARAKTTIVQTTDGGTTFTIRVTGIDPSSVPEEGVGAHLHVGPCDPPGSGGHYKDGDPLAAASPQNEVWFDLVPNEEGMAYDETSVSFVPVDLDGQMSIVIHQGIASIASTKQACFPLDVPQWIPAPSPTE